MRSNNAPLSSDNVPLSCEKVPLSSNNVPLGSHNVYFHSNNVPLLKTLVLVLPLLDCDCVQASISLGLVIARLWFCSGFPRSWSYLCWAMGVNRLSLVLNLTLLGCGFDQASRVLVLPLLGCGYAQATPSLYLAFAGLWLCTCFPLSVSCL